MKKTTKADKISRIHRKIRAKISGTLERPRLMVSKSNEYIYAQIINDDKAETILTSNDMKINSGTKSERAAIVGKDIAEKCKSKNIKKVVFDRGGFVYKGRIAILAQSARDNGLEF
ncbi:MAG: 50S ribosomal protein L18 [Cyanobium sp. MAG06]|nr:50S ribosomal protein L18 [Cyanobium sp. MAG06]